MNEGENQEQPGGEASYEQYWKWLTRTLHERGYSYRQLEREAGLANAAIGGRARKNLHPNDTVLEAVQQSLGVSVREQMERAGMIKPVDELVGDSEYHQIFEVLRRLTPGNVRNVLRYLEFQFPDAVKAARKSVAGHHASNEPAEAEAEADA